MPTTNPVPSQDPSDLLFNAGKLDEVVNGTASSFTDRLGAERRTVAGMNADFDAQLADAESDLNVYRADAASSAAEALGYLQTIRATSYGAYANDPVTDPLGNPPTVGDEYFNTTANLLKRWNGATWQASDINTANLAAPSGSSLVGYTQAGTGAVATTVDDALQKLSVIVTNFKCSDGQPVKIDGVHDDTTGIIAAIEYVKSKGGGYVVFPQTGFDAITTFPVKVYSNVRLVAEQGTNFIGPFQNNKPGIKKTTNTTVAITNFDTGAVYSVDCIFYTEFSLFAGVDYLSGAAQDFYPQQFGLKNLFLKGGAPLPITAGVHMDFGSNMVMENCDAIGVTHAFYGRNIFVSKLDNVRTSGKITIAQAATSLILDNCSARNGFYIQGAYYSSLRACTSDEGSGQAAYKFVSCHGVTIDACGSERTVTGDAQRGVFEFAGGNHSMVMINPVVGHAVGSTSPAISVGDFDRVTVVGGDFGMFASDAPSAYDVYGASNSAITLLNTKFIGSTVLSNPIAATLVGGAYPSVCTYEYNGVRKVKTSTKEYTNGYRSGTWTPVLQFGGGNTGMTGTFSGEWREDGNMLVAYGYIDLTAKGTSTGTATITMPASNGFALPVGGGPKFGVVTFGSQENVTAGIAYGKLNNAGAVTAALLGDTGAALTDTTFTNTTRLRFRIEMPLV